MPTRLAYIAETQGLLHSEQIGGRPARSAVGAVMALVHDVQQANCNGKVLSALFVDVKGTFDNVSSIQLLLILQSLGIPPTVLSWTDTFLSERQRGLAFDGGYLPISLFIRSGVCTGYLAVCASRGAETTTHVGLFYFHVFYCSTGTYCSR